MKLKGDAMLKSREVKGVKKFLVALAVICMLMAGEFAIAAITAKSTVLINENDPRIIKRLLESRDENVAEQKNLWFNVGKDANNPKAIKGCRLAEISLKLERCGYDSFSVIEYTLKSGTKIGSISVLARKQPDQFKDFMDIIEELIGSKAADGNCVVTISQIEESDQYEVYTIFFDLDGDEWG